MKTLLNISDDMAALDDLLDQCTDDLSDPRVAEAIEKWESELSIDFEQKVENYVRLIKELEARAMIREQESRRLLLRSRVDSNHADWLKERLLGVWQRHGFKTVETASFKVGIANNGGKQPLKIEEGQLPREWMLEKVVIEADKERIRAELESGGSVPGASLLPRGQRMNIR